MTRILSLAFLLLCGACATRCCLGAQPSDVTRFVDDDTVAVARLDLERFDSVALGKLAKTLAENLNVDPSAPTFASLMAPLAALEKTAVAAKQAGIKDFHLIYGVQDIMLAPPLLVARLPEGEQQAMVAGLGMPAFVPRHTIHDGFAFWGTQEQIDKIRTKKGQPRPDLESALADGAPALLKIAAALSADGRRVFRGSATQLPAPLTGLTGSNLGDDLEWMTIAFDLPPQPVVKVVIRGANHDSTKKLAIGLTNMRGIVEKREDMRRWLPKWPEIVQGLAPLQDGDRLALTLNSDQLHEQAKLLAPTMSQLLAAWFRSRSANNLKQLGLALHVHHDEHSLFPAQAITGPKGNKLLSWRVNLLPQLGHGELYSQFRLNEPWDSEHNKQLIPKMPPVFASPFLPPELAAKGLTTYLVPMAENTLFGGEKSTSFLDILDGTSLTIAIVEAAPVAARIWTKPEDLEVAKENPFKNLAGQYGNSFQTLFADGGVRTIRDDYPAAKLWNLFLRNDGEPRQFP